MASSQAQAEITERRLRPLYGEGGAEGPDHVTELCTTRFKIYKCTLHHYYVMCDMACARPSVHLMLTQIRLLLKLL